MKGLISTLLLIIMGHFVSGQGISRHEADTILKSLSKNIKDNTRIHALLRLVEFNIHKKGEFKADLDSAELFLDQAKYVNAKIKSLENDGNIKLLQAFLAGEKGQHDIQRKLTFTAINILKSTKDYFHTAQAYFEIALDDNIDDPSQLPEMVNYLQQAIIFYDQSGHKQFKADALKILANVHLKQGKADLAEKELLQVLYIFRSINYKDICYTYDLLASATFWSGNSNKALFYALKSIETVGTRRDSLSLFTFYCRIAVIYNELGKIDLSLDWYKEALNISVTKYSQYIFLISKNIVLGLVQEHKPRVALNFILNESAKYNPVDIEEKKFLKQSLAVCYTALKNYPLADKYYLEMVKLNNENRKKIWTSNRKNTLALDHYRMGDFYVVTRQYKKANIYLKKALNIYQEGYSHIHIKDVYLDLFRADSALGNYISAIKYLRQYQILKDSIFNITKSKQIEELQIAYETDQKQKDIKLLESKEKIQQIKLQHTENTRNWSIAGAALLFLLLGVSYNRYLFKQKSNKKLEGQQKEISHINSNLNKLVVEKDSLLLQKDHLLKEKGWLLKEVHHRVKNNLHMVICLLESQAAYLESDALKAIENSQNRIYAMSLIHQKLYQSDDIKSIDMAVYLPEFVRYLSDSFGRQDKIRFQLEIEPLMLGVSQAIPIALIINEAATNSIKYAFPGERKGIIEIAMHQSAEQISLIIADNGIGIDPAFANKPSDSLGLKLMKGLSEDISGRISFENDYGTRITIIFNVDPLNNTNIILEGIAGKEVLI